MAKISINIKEGTLQKKSTTKEIIVGIDLGTTNSLVAYMDGASNTAKTITDPDGDNKLVPSIIHFAENQTVLVGKQAADYLETAPERTIYSVKRLMGKAYDDLGKHTDYFGYKIIDDDTESLVKIKVGERFYSPIELSAFILRQLKTRIENHLNATVSKAVITVPAYFNDTQRQATRDAGKLAGLEVLRIVNEPTAAGLAYGMGLDGSEPAQTIAVYDLGGGTFDISILRIEGGVFEVLATNGDTYLGGDDFDRAIIEHWLQKNGLSGNELKNDKSLSQSLRLAAEKAKIALSATNEVKIPSNSFDLSLSRIKLEELIAPLIEKTLTACKNALKDAKLKIGDIDAVILVGGSTRVPAVSSAVAKLFNREPLTHLNPDEVVALGAAVQADILAGNNKDMLLLDLTPLSLGIETMGGLMDVIIPRNTTVPAKAARQYTTQVDGQANMRITVYQGERDLVEHNRKLGEFHLSGIPAMPAGLAKVEISFIIDADGILRVKAKELRSGVEQGVEMRSQYGLSPEAMAQMLLDSVANAQSDMQLRALLEARNEAERLIAATQKFIEKNEAQLMPVEIGETRKLVEQLQSLLSSNDKDLLQIHSEALNEYTRPFAQRIMDVAISKAMKGKKV